MDALDVLVVDDDPTVRLLLTRVLRPGYRVRLAADGDEALAMVRAERPAAILCDLAMPGMSGDELILKIRQIYPYLPIVVMTATPAALLATRAIRADAYLGKPFSISAVVPALDDAIARAHRTQSLDDARRSLAKLTVQLGGRGTTST